ncbi:MAG TPA: hypothetical protein VN699_10690 [Pirellulales bacterium]|jgi:hypothetical protein|nr:hypothetical protein [Pirellulales bacterium]
MGRLAMFILGMGVGGALVYGAERYHVLRTNQGLETVPKLSASFSETYVDVRGFGPSDWADHQGLAADVLRARKEYLIQGAVADKVRQKVDGLLQDLAPPGSGS